MYLKKIIKRLLFAFAIIAPICFTSKVYASTAYSSPKRPGKDSKIAVTYNKPYSAHGTTFREVNIKQTKWIGNYTKLDSKNVTLEKGDIIYISADSSFASQCTASFGVNVNLGDYVTPGVSITIPLGRQQKSGGVGKVAPKKGKYKVYVWKKYKVTTAYYQVYNRTTKSWKDHGHSNPKKEYLDKDIQLIIQ